MTIEDQATDKNVRAGTRVAVAATTKEFLCKVMIRKLDFVNRVIVEVEQKIKSSPDIFFLEGSITTTDSVSLHSSPGTFFCCNVMFRRL